MKFLSKWRLRTKIVAGVAIAGLLFGVIGILVSIPTAVVNYQFITDAITSPIRLVVVSDLHSCSYGENQQELIDLIKTQNPDGILFPGDIIDDHMPEKNAITVLRWAGEHYPSYYVTGNHEFWTWDIERIYKIVEDCGVNVLRGNGESLTVGDDTIHIYGVDDAWSESMMFQLSTMEMEDGYNILLAHRPEWIEEYSKQGFDLVVSGHAHGGQWRIPFLLNGLLAPNQGFFPQYAGGLYEVNGTDFVVSRGLARESTRVPRIYNPPELVVIDLLPSM